MFLLVLGVRLLGGKLLHKSTELESSDDILTAVLFCHNVILCL